MVFVFLFLTSLSVIISSCIHFAASGILSFFLWLNSIPLWASRVVQVVKNPSAKAEDIRDVGLIPGLGSSPGGGSDNPLQYSCLENPMDRGAFWITVHRVTKSQTGLKWLSMHTVFHCIYRYHIFFIHSSVDGHLDCFHYLDCFDYCEQCCYEHRDMFISFWIIVFSGYISRSRIAGSYGNSIFSWENCSW